MYLPRILVETACFMLFVAFTHACTRLTATTTEQTFDSHAAYSSQNYPSDTDECWVIDTEDGFVVRLYAEAFELEDEEECLYDALALYCGGDRDNLLAEYCGYTGPGFEFSTDGGSFYLRFQSDGSVQADGYRIAYQAVETSSVAESLLCDVRYEDNGDNDLDDGDDDEPMISAGGVAGLIVLGVIALIVLVVLIAVICIVMKTASNKGVVHGTRTQPGSTSGPPPSYNQSTRARPTPAIFTTSGTRTQPGGTRGPPPSYSQSTGAPAVFTTSGSRNSTLPPIGQNQGHSQGHHPPQSHGQGHHPPQGHSQGHHPPQGHSQGHQPPQGHGQGHQPPQGHGQGHQSLQGHGHGHYPPQVHGQGHQPPQGHGQGHHPTQGHGQGHELKPGDHGAPTPAALYHNP